MCILPWALLVVKSVLWNTIADFLYRLFDSLYPKWIPVHELIGNWLTPTETKSFIFAITSYGFCGNVVPIPTLPEPLITTLSDVLV